jgi:quinol monooxygenase YgiN
MIHVSIRMQIPDPQRDEVLRILGTLSQQTRYKAGCVSSRVFRGGEEEDGILLDEVWDDDKFLEHHFRTANFNKVIQLTELSSAPPEFRFETVLHTAGMEAIAKARNISGG